MPEHGMIRNQNIFCTSHCCSITDNIIKITCFLCSKTHGVILMVRESLSETAANSQQAFHLLLVLKRVLH
jgi:hypothetical protein